MTTSGRLIETLAGALRVPPAVVMTTTKALRTSGMVSVRGRGTSAANMTVRDAAVLLTAIGSGASTSYVSKATDMLMRMPLRFSRRPGRKGFGDLRGFLSHPFFAMTGEHTFIEGLESVLTDEIKTDEWFEESRPARVNLLDRPEMLSLTIIMDLEKQGGAALLKTGSWKKTEIFNVYSTWPEKAGCSQQDGLPNLFDAFRADVSGFTGHYFRGEVLEAALKAIQEPTVRTRRRKPRAGRVARR